MKKQSKYCPKCARNLPANSKYFYKDKTKSDGWNWCCKQCVASQRGTEFRKPVPDVRSGHKWCRSCESVKPFREFHRKAGSKDGYNATCKKCRSENEGFGYKKTARPGFKFCTNCAEELPANSNNFYADNGQTGGLSSWCIPCVKKRAKRWGQDNPEKRKDSNKKWLKRNPFAKKIFADRRRARVDGTACEFTKEDWERALSHFGGCCAICGKQPGFWHTLSMDHWIPVSDPNCPGTIPSNIIPLCHGRNGCNNSKGAKDPRKWLIEKYGKRRANDTLKRIDEYFSLL